MNFWAKLFALGNDLFFHWDLSGISTSSGGDGLLNYFIVFILAPFALVLTVFWKSEARYGHWIDTYIRWFLAAQLLNYGLAKVFVGQFPQPGITKLIEPYGQSSPMGLLWVFMGYSRAYSIFGGLAEVAAGILLLIPSTITLGALVSLAVMANVFMLNMCYDVPVKIVSFQMLMYSLYFLSCDFRRLFTFFFTNCTVPTKEFAPGKKKHKWLYATLTILLVLTEGKVALGYVEQWDELLNHTPHFGIWKFEMEADSDWELAIFEIRDRFTLKFHDGRFVRFSIDPAKIRIDQLNDNMLVIDGEIDGKRVRRIARKQPIPEFPLLTRGFHWIQESSFNR